MKRLVYDRAFAEIGDDPMSRVFMVYPAVFEDGRGYFAEVMKEPTTWPDGEFPIWFGTRWIKQINRSKSVSGTVRGCHAQAGVYCQAKLVQALTTKIFDIITDARPDSDTFGASNVYVLDPDIQNILFVPRGFLHAFAVPFGGQDAVFEYFCDNIYNHGSEIGINPDSLLPDVVRNIREQPTRNAEYQELFNMFDNRDRLVLSDRDRSGFDYKAWMAEIKNNYDKGEKAWYR